MCTNHCHRVFAQLQLANISIYIYIYIYVCVCVCVLCIYTMRVYCTHIIYMYECFVDCALLAIV
jgi:hypothetical protein